MNKRNNFYSKKAFRYIHLVTDDGLYDRKAFYTVKIVSFIHPL